MKNAFLIILSLIIYCNKVEASDTLFLKNGNMIPVVNCEYKSMNKLYFESKQSLYFVRREEVSHLKHLIANDFDTTWKILSFDQITEKISVRESPYNIGKKGLILQQKGMLLTLALPMLCSGTALFTGAEELLFVGGASFIAGVTTWYRGIRKQKTAFDLYNAVHYNEN